MGDGGTGHPAAAASGIVDNDVIVAIDGRSIDNHGQLLPILAERRAGQAIAVDDYRGSEKRTVSTLLAARPQ